MLPDLKSTDLRVTGRGLNETEKELNCCGFAGAIGTQKTEDFSCIDTQIEPAQRDVLAVDLLRRGGVLTKAGRFAGRVRAECSAILKTHKHLFRVERK